MSFIKTSPLYKHSGKVPFASCLAFLARRMIFRRFMAEMRPTPGSRVLDVGVTSDTRFRESNFFEQFYPYPEHLVCVGTEDGAHLEEQQPGVRFIQIQPGQQLPFGDREFDFVFSNAVVEHVGGWVRQRAFVAEICRVARRVFIATPNRWFAVESHTGVPFLHYLPKTIYRYLIRMTPLAYWAYEKNLNLLTRLELVSLFPDGYPVVVDYVGIGPGRLKSNLVAYTAVDKDRKAIG